MLPWNFSVAFNRALTLHIIIVIFVFFPSPVELGLLCVTAAFQRSPAHLQQPLLIFQPLCLLCLKEFTMYFICIQTKKCFPSPSTPHHQGFLTNRMHGFLTAYQQTQMLSITHILKQTLSDTVCKVPGNHKQHQSNLSKYLQSQWCNSSILCSQEALLRSGSHSLRCSVKTLQVKLSL